MGYFKFGNGATKYQGHIKSKTANIITIEFDSTVPQKTTVDGKGATWYNDGDFAMGDYSGFTTPYCWHDGIYQLSNDGSVFVPTIRFTSSGGTLTGEAVQHVSSYSDLVVPTPVDDENWEFQNWNPSVPTSGVIHENETYQAVFEYIGTPPVPEPTMEQRVSDLDEITNELLYETTMLEIYYPIEEESEV